MPFADQFISRGGIPILTSIILASSGNLLSYALAAVPMLAERSPTFLNENAQIFGKVVESLDEGTANVLRNSLAIVKSYCAQGPGSADIVHHGFVSGNGKPYEALLRHVSSNDLDVQQEALAAINAVISISSVAEQREAFLAAADEFKLSQTLREHLNQVELVAFREQAYEYQCHRLAAKRTAFKTMFNPDETPYHEGLLLKYWNSVFPGEPLTEASQWRRIGFQTTDPASELRSTGVLGLTDAIAFAEGGGEILRSILDAQKSRPERDYPVTAAWLSVTGLLVETFKLHKDPISGETGDLFSCLFDSGSAYFDVYCVGVQAFDKMWDDLNCTYEDFGKATAIIKHQMQEVFFSNPDSIVNLRRLAFLKATGLKKRIGSVEEAFASMNLRESEAPQVVSLRERLSTDMMSVVYDQRFSIMRQGGLFHVVKPDGKNSKRFVLKVMLSPDNTTLIYGTVPETGEPIHQTGATVQLNDAVQLRNVRSMEFGMASPMMQALKKADEQLASLTFSLMLNEPLPTGEPSLDFSCLNKREYIIWTEGLSALLKHPIKSTLASEDAAALADLALRSSLAELDGGVEIPAGTPERPARPPTNWKVDLVALAATLKGT